MRAFLFLLLATTVSSQRKNLLAYVNNWGPCVSDNALSNYNIANIAFAVSYQWASPRVQCSTTCTVSPVDSCTGMNLQAYVNRIKARGARAMLSFGGANMGGSWQGNVNHCWEHCFSRTANLATQLVNIVRQFNFDGIDIDYEYFVNSTLHTQFLIDLTQRLRTGLGANAIITHVPMDADVVPGKLYYNVLQQLRNTLSFLLVQYYNGPNNPFTNWPGTLAHYRQVVTMMGGDASKILFGFCAQGCSPSATSAQAVAVLRQLDAAVPSNGGSFFWEGAYDLTGQWSGAVRQYYGPRAEANFTTE